MNFTLYRKLLIAKQIIEILAIIFLCAGLFFIGAHLNNTLTLLDIDAIDIDTSFSIINNPKNGTLAAIDKLIYTTKSVLVHSDMILGHEEKQLTTLDKQTAQLFNDFHNFTLGLSDTLVSVNNVADSVKTSVDTTTLSLQEMPNTILKIKELVVDIDNRVNDPAVNKLMNSLAETSTQIEGTATNVNKVTTHLEQVIDNPKPLTFKQKIGSFFNILWKIGMLAK